PEAARLATRWRLHGAAAQAVSRPHVGHQRQERRHGDSRPTLRIKSFRQTAADGRGGRRNHRNAATDSLYIFFMAQNRLFCERQMRSQNSEMKRPRIPTMPN